MLTFMHLCIPPPNQALPICRSDRQRVDRNTQQASLLQKHSISLIYTRWPLCVGSNGLCICAYVHGRKPVVGIFLQKREERELCPNT